MNNLKFIKMIIVCEKFNYESVKGSFLAKNFDEKIESGDTSVRFGQVSNLMKKGKRRRPFEYRPSGGGKCGKSPEKPAYSEECERCETTLNVSPIYTELAARWRFRVCFSFREKSF